MWEAMSESYGDPVFQEFDMTALKVDEAYLKFSSSLEGNVSVYEKSSLCYRCPFKRSTNLPAGESLTMKYDTNPYWSFIFSYASEDFLNYPGRSEEEICSFESQSLGQFGVYELNVNPSYCDFKVLKKPVFIYTGLILAFIFYFVAAFVYAMVKWSRRKSREDQSKKQQLSKMMMNGSLRPPPQHPPGMAGVLPNGSPPAPAAQGPPPRKSTRLHSLDTFRGITIVLMILVNYGGGKYWFLEHAPWNGLRVADVIFPWFLWIMGVCIPMGLKSQLKKEVPKLKIFRRIGIRSLKLFALGLILNTVGGHNQLETLRIPGVLQRFAISYFFTSSVYLLCGSPFANDSIKGMAKPVGDLVLLFPQWVIYILLTIGYAVFIFLMPNPGCPRGYFGPGGIVLLQGGKPSPDCIGGITRMVDIWVLGSSHIYQNPSAKSIYETSAFDPEGILGSIPTILQVFLGIQAGQTLQTFKSHGSRLKRWMAWAVGTLVVSLALSSGIIIGGPIPVNKNLWSLSFVFLTSSTAFLLLSASYALVDYLAVWEGAPFRQTGMNSIFLYVAHFFTYNVFPWRFSYGSMNSHLALFSQALFGTSLWVLVALYLHKKKKFYTV